MGRVVLLPNLRMLLELFLHQSYTFIPWIKEGRNYPRSRLEMRNDKQRPSLERMSEKIKLAASQHPSLLPRCPQKHCSWALKGPPN